MKILIAIDSFKGSLSSSEAGGAVKEGFLSALGDADVSVFPIADGGEGTLDALICENTKIRTAEVCGPVRRPVTAKYGIDSSLAIIESAEAIGLTLLSPDEKDPLKTTTYGLGELILKAISEGARDFVIGIGGSATNDCGIGMLTALGFSFLSKENKKCVHGAAELEKIAYIDSSGAIPELADCSFTVACDVKNPLCGENGASLVYSLQKGASRGDALRMDAALARFAELCSDFSGERKSDLPGAGAAGGLGFAFTSFLNARLESGINVILSKSALEKEISKADLVITGEGRLDLQSANGKVPIGVAALAKKYGKRVISFSGSIGRDAEFLNGLGIDAFFPILREPISLEHAMEKHTAYENLKASAAQAARLISLYTR